MAQKDPVERAVEIFVLAPVGAGLLALESAPGVIDTCVGRARSEIDRRQEEIARHVTTVRSTGEMAMVFGWPKLRARLDRRITAARTRVEDAIGRGARTAPAAAPATPTPPVPAPVAAAVEPVAVEPVAVEPVAVEPVAEAEKSAIVFAYPARPAADAPDSDTLPIPGYDALSASQVVERLAGLQPDELDAVHAYETAHRGRRTILGKIEQLAG
jgi:hypothetical protein